MCKIFKSEVDDIFATINMWKDETFTVKYSDIDVLSDKIKAARTRLSKVQESAPDVEDTVYMIDIGEGKKPASSLLDG